MRSLINTNGYKENSPNKHNAFNIIPSNIITMRGVNRPLLLVPIVGGEPQYDQKVKAKPGQDDVVFDATVDAVLEIPLAQEGAITPLVPNRIDLAELYIKKGEMGTSPYFYAHPEASYQDVKEIADKKGLRAPEISISTESEDKSRQKRRLHPLTSFNPYGGVNADTAFAHAGAAFGKGGDELFGKTGKWFAGIAGLGKGLLSGARNFMSGMGASNIYNEKLQEYAEEKKKKSRESGQYYAPSAFNKKLGGLVEFMQDGGTKEMEEYSAFLDYYKKAAKALEEGDKETLKEISYTNDMYSTSDLTNDFHILNSLRKKANLGIKDEVDYVVPHVKATIGSTFNDVSDYIKEIDWFKKGGEKLATGNFITGDENNPRADTMVEAKEHILFPDGSNAQVIGDRHSDKSGGELLELPGGTKVVSDYLQIGGKNSKKIREKYDLKTRASNKYATVVTQYRKKIGLTELIEEEEALIKKIADQRDNTHDDTRNLNLEVLGGKLRKIQQQKSPLEDDMASFIDFIFNLQEESKEKSHTKSSMQEGGEVTQADHLIKAIEAYATNTGQDPMQVVQRLENMEKPEAEKFIQEIVSQVSSSPEGPNQGAMDLKQVITVFSKMNGVSPEEVVSKIQSLPEEQQKQAIEEMVLSVKQSQSPQKEQPIEYMQEGAEKRTNRKYEPSKLLDFAWIHPYAKAEYSLQHKNDKGFYDDFDYGERLGIYDKYAGGLFDNLYEKTDDGFKMRSGRKYEEFQSGYNDMMKSTAEYMKSKGYSADDVDKFLKDVMFLEEGEDTSRLVDGLEGQYSTTRSFFTRKMLPPDQVKQLNDLGIYTARDVENNKDKVLSIIDENSYSELLDGLDKFSDADYIIGSKELEDKEPDESKDPQDGGKVDDTDLTNTPISSLPPFVVDQGNLPPIMLSPSMREVKNFQADKIHISPEKAITAAKNQTRVASSMIKDSNPYTSPAALAALQTGLFKATNSAYTAANAQNAQDERNVNNINESRIEKTDSTNQRYMDQYEKNVLTGLDNYHKEWLNFIDAKNQERLGNFNYVQEKNKYDVLTPNYKELPDGTIVLAKDNKLHLPNSSIKEDFPYTDEIGQFKYQTIKGNNGKTKKQKIYKAKKGMYIKQSFKDFLNNYKLD